MRFESPRAPRVKPNFYQQPINRAKHCSRTTGNHTSDSSSSTNPSGSPTSLIYHDNLFLYLTSLPPSILTPPPTVESLSPVGKRKHPQSVKFLNYLDPEPKRASRRSRRLHRTSPYKYSQYDKDWIYFCSVVILVYSFLCIITINKQLSLLSKCVFRKIFIVAYCNCNCNWT